MTVEVHMAKREFRTQESYKAEHETRRIVGPFLKGKGFQVLTDSYQPEKKVQSQTICAIAPSGERLTMRVKLCWRKTGNRAVKTKYSAAQLIAKVKNNDWRGEIERLAARAEKEGITHFLLVGREDLEVTQAALLPMSELARIWFKQRDISADLLSRGALGQRKKNHATNGHSPTIWLQDDFAPQVAEALWNHHGVLDVVRMQTVPCEPAQDDTFDDLPAVNYELIGNDDPARVLVMRSEVRRDPQVRRMVLLRANGKCEREACGFACDYLGFFDVHHIFGIEKSDRVYTCVTLCPNCHRAAHFAPDRDQVNEGLAKFAMKFKS